MITLPELQTKALKIWHSQLIQRAFLDKQSIIPIFISIRSLSAKALQEDALILRQRIRELINHSKEHVGYGYDLSFKTINHRQLGQQQIPDSLQFDTLPDFLKFIDKEQEYQLFCETAHQIISAQPLLAQWALANTVKVLIFKNEWPRILEVCRYFLLHPQPNCYLRELDIPEVDTKFVEQHKTILSECFEQLLPITSINHATPSHINNSFELRYGLKFDEQIIRFRVLDQNILPALALSDLSVPLSQFITLNLPCKYIYITENKISGLSFPRQANSIVIFGLGYGVQSLKNIEWFQDKQLYYWGDIDTHGFAMLSQMRSYYPQTQSLLMDRDTLMNFKSLWVVEPEAKRCLATLSHLTTEEQILYQDLVHNRIGMQVRLEQERISFAYLCQRF